MYEPERLTSFDSVLGPESYASPVDAGDLYAINGGAGVYVYMYMCVCLYNSGWKSMDRLGCDGVRG